MSTIIANKYEILESLGEGTFGRVFKCKNIKSNEEIAMKIQHKDIINILKHEAKIYKYLKDISGVPNIRHYGSETGFNYLILDLLGPSLSDISLNHYETINYMIQSINILESIHNIGVIHRDIKPDNFLLSIDKKTLYLIDFGLAKYYLTSEKKHMEERKDRKLIGTAKYSSINVHNGAEASRRDDVESLCYCFILLYGKELPWSNVIDEYNKKVAYNSDQILDKQSLQKKYYSEIKNIKSGTLEWLYDIPGEFITILLYCRQLKFDEKPNYNYIRGLLNNYKMSWE